MNENIVFRVDSGSVIGAGHLMRCIALAERLASAGFSIHFICCNYVGYLGSLIESYGYKLHVNNTSYKPEVNNPKKWIDNQLDDATYVKKIIHQLGGIKWLVVDHYGLNQSWKGMFSNLVVISDEFYDDSFCKILVGQNPKSIDNQDIAERQGKKLLGVKYYLLRSQFISSYNNRSKCVKGDNSVLITMGSTDPTDTVGTLIDFLLNTKFKINIMLSSSSSRLSQLKEKYSSQPVQWYVDHQDVNTLYSEMDYIIGTPSVSAMERAAKGIPSVLIKTSDDQQYIGEYLSSQNAAVYINDMSKLNREKLLEMLSQCSGLTFDSKQVCDGLGSFRVADELVGRQFSLRKAGIHDIDTLYQWQSMPNVRKYFKNPNVPSYKEHVAWFENTIKSKNIDLYIGEWFGFPCAMGRLDHNDEGLEVSILIDPKFQGNKLSNSLMRDIAKRYVGNKLIAKVHKNNSASLQCFISSGFVNVSEDKYVRMA